VLAVEEALSIVLDNVRPLGTEEIDFDAGVGRLLREDVISDLDMPPFPRSAVDGFAVRAEDLAHAPARFQLVGEIPAGSFPDFRIERGQAAPIMTGAPVPDGADAVQMVERSRHDGDHVELLEQVHSGQNVAPRGSEVAKGDVVLRAGTRLDPPAVAVSATVGKTRLVVGRRPRASVIATGDELVPPSEFPGPGQIRNSNGFSLVAQCTQAGTSTRYLGVASDTESSLEALIRHGLDDDLLLLSGGVSMGRFDLVEKVLERLGVRLLFDAIALKPGKPLVFGLSKNGTLVFGLPGNPVSTMVTFELFVRPAIARLEGASHPVRPLLRASLRAPLANRGSRRAFLPGWVRPDGDGALLAFPIPTRGSGDIVSFSKANALLIVAEDRDTIPAGDDVRFYPLDSFLDKEDRWQAANDPR
jgi:molybdopterin molybdotransferase